LSVIFKTITTFKLFCKSLHVLTNKECQTICLDEKIKGKLKFKNYYKSFQIIKVMEQGMFLVSCNIPSGYHLN